MQLLIFLTITTSAFAGGEFQAKVKAHAEAVTAVKEQVKIIGDAQIRFKKTMETCEPKNISSQETLLNCGQKMLQLSYELQDLDRKQTKVRNTVAKLSPEFTQASSSLMTTLNESSKILNLLISEPKKLSDSFFAMNSIYVSKQFDLQYRDAFSAAKIKTFCSSLQSDMESLTQIGQFSLDSKLPFSTIYKQQHRIRNVLVLANGISPLCKMKYNVTNLAQVYSQLAAQITPAAFLAFKNSVCDRPKPEAKLDVQTCKNLPLTPYSIQWLEQARGVK